MAVTKNIATITDNAFDESNRQVQETLIPNRPERFPHLFTDHGLKEQNIAFNTSRERWSVLVNTNEIDYEKSSKGEASTNIFWASSINPSRSEIHASLRTRGFELSNIPPALLRYKDKKTNSLRYKILEGRTRLEWLIFRRQMKNVICDIYDANEGATELDIKRSIQTYGWLANNIQRDPKGKTSVEDFVRNVKLILEADPDSAKIDPVSGNFELDSVKKLVSRLDSSGNFEKRISEIAKKALNSMSSSGVTTWNKKTVYEWLAGENLQGSDYTIVTNQDNEIVCTNPTEDQESFYRERGDCEIRHKKRLYKDTVKDGVGVKYMAFETSTGYRDAFREVVTYMKNNPNVDLRIILHKQTPHPNYPLTEYNRERETFITYFEDMVHSVVNIFTDGAPLKKLPRDLVYGCAPICHKSHNMQNLIRYDSAKREWYQTEKMFGLPDLYDENGEHTDVFNVVNNDDIGDW